MITHDENLVTLEELDSVLAAYEEALPAGSRGGFRRDVLAPGGRRRSFVVALVVAVAALAAGTAFGGVQQMLDWFEGTPPTAAVQQTYLHWNVEANLRNYELAQASMVADAPTVDPNTVHGVLALQLDSGTAYLWNGALSDGGACWLVQLSDASGSGGAANIGDGCPTSSQFSATSVLEQIPDGSSELALGRAPGAASVSLGISDGTTVQASVVEGYFLASIPNGSSVQSLTSH